MTQPQWLCQRSSQLARNSAAFRQPSTTADWLSVDFSHGQEIVPTLPVCLVSFRILFNMRQPTTAPAA
jgi:hypothetical protein